MISKELPYPKCNGCPFATQVTEYILDANPNTNAIALSCDVNTIKKEAYLSAMIKRGHAIVNIGPSTGTPPKFCPQLPQLDK